jgi:hypothetical protein
MAFVARRSIVPIGIPHRFASLLFHRLSPSFDATRSVDETVGYAEGYDDLQQQILGLEAGVGGSQADLIGARRVVSVMAVSAAASDECMSAYAIGISE